MKVQIFLQSELLDDVEVIEVESMGGHAALRAACLAKIEQQSGDEVWVPESAVGFVFAALILLIGLWIKHTGKQFERYLRS